MPAQLYWCQVHAAQMLLQLEANRHVCSSACVAWARYLQSRPPLPIFPLSHLESLHGGFQPFSAVSPFLIQRTLPSSRPGSRVTGFYSEHLVTSDRPGRLVGGAFACWASPGLHHLLDPVTTPLCSVCAPRSLICAQVRIEYPLRRALAPAAQIQVQHRIRISHHNVSTARRKGQTAWGRMSCFEPSFCVRLLFGKSLDCCLSSGAW